MSELEQGIAAAKAGRRAEARELLLQAVQTDERSEQAWLWLAGVMEDPEDMRVCLENVLELNPANPRAQQGLKWIEERYGPRPATPAPAPTPPDPAPALTTTPPAQPIPAAPVGLSSTHTTMNLDAHMAASALASMPGVALTAAPAPSVSLSTAADSGPRQMFQASALPPVTLPCPYCGATSALADTHCPRCRRSLMTRGAIPDKRSASTTTLAVFWGIGAAATLLLTILVVTVLRDNSAEFRRGSLTTLQFSNVMLAALVLGCLIQFGMTYGLWVRKRWAYIVQVLMTTLGFISNMLQLVAVALSMGAVLSRMPSRGVSTSAAGGLSAGIILCTLILILIPVALTVSSYRDFFGQKMRIDTQVSPAADPRINYNNGLAFKSKGMWYLAAREWEASLAKAPTDVASLHALALAYAQLKQFEQARTTIQRAINVAPDNPALQDSRALIDQLALKGAGAKG